MAKFKVIIGSYRNNYQQELENQLENIYIKNKDYLDTIPNDITLSFNQQGAMPIIGLTLAKGADIKHHMEKVHQLLGDLKL